LLALAGSTSAYRYEPYYDVAPLPENGQPIYQDTQYYAPDRIEYAQVVSATPIYQSVRVSQPRQECWQERRVDQNIQAGWGGGGWNGGILGTPQAQGSLIGGLAGGVLGNQFGRGRGRNVATAVGAVIGANIGSNIATERAQRQAPREYYEQRCRTVDNGYNDQRIQAYDVSYRYNGQLYRTQMPYHPGSRLPVRLDVQPVR
jgi:uncharacterized protein YcfJ